MKKVKKVVDKSISKWYIYWALERKHESAKSHESSKNFEKRLKNFLTKKSKYAKINELSQDRKNFENWMINHPWKFKNNFQNEPFRNKRFLKTVKDGTK